MQRRARFETEMIQTISVSHDSLRWIKKGKEALINGRLFDVESFTVSGTSISLTGFYDHQEEKLEAQLSELAEQGNDPAGPSRSLSLIKFIFAPAYSVPVSLLVQCPWHLIYQGPAMGYIEAIQNQVRPADIPPPKHC